MRPLYEISNEYEQLLYECEVFAQENGGELPPDLSARLEAVNMERSQKIGNIVRFYKNLEIEDEAITEQIRRFEKRRKPIRALRERLKKALTDAIQPGEKIAEDDYAVGWRSSLSTEIPDESAVPEQYCKYERVVQVEEIKKDLKGGANFSFAFLSKKNNIQIR